MRHYEEILLYMALHATLEHMWGSWGNWQMHAMEAQYQLCTVWHFEILLPFFYTFKSTSLYLHHFPCCCLLLYTLSACMYI